MDDVMPGCILHTHTGSASGRRISFTINFDVSVFQFLKIIIIGSVAWREKPSDFFLTTQAAQGCKTTKSDFKSKQKRQLGVWL